MPQFNENHEIQLFSRVADARVNCRQKCPTKMSAKCAIAHEQADDKADAALLDSCEAKKR
jgi:hypothetical protein